jgi:hypothetical protein
MCSCSLMCGVSDYKVFTNVCHGNSDHQLLVATLQLRLRVPPWAATFRGVWDVAVMRGKPEAVVDFCRLLRNRFTLMSPNLLDLEVEWSALECEIFEAVG